MNVLFLDCVDSLRGFDYNSYKAAINKFDNIFEGKDGS